MFLLDTNVISEVRKAHRCNVGVARWFAGVSDADLSPDGMRRSWVSVGFLGIGSYRVSKPLYSRRRGEAYARSSFSCALIRRACGLPRTGR